MIVIVTIKGLVIPKHLFVIVMKLGLNLKIVQVRVGTETAEQENTRTIERGTYKHTNIRNLIISHKPHSAVDIEVDRWLHQAQVEPV